MSRIVFEQTQKRYPGADKLSLIDFSLDIADGEFLVLVGPSGCGKTTALRCLAGLEDISGGHILIGDKIVDDLQPKARDLAMVFQSYALYPHMTVFDNMAFSIKLRKTPKDEVARRVKEAAQILGLEPFLDRRPGQMSGGQRQRVALGRAIVRDPAAFLMDEPLSNLDAKLRVQTRAEIARIHRRLGATIVYVTHDQVEAMTMGDRIAVMRDGLLQQVGTPRDLYETPVNRFVAGFIGSPAMNFLEGTLTTDGAQPTLRVGDVEVALTGRAAAVARERKAGDALVIGVRPEHLELSRNGAANAIHLPATVDVVEFLGNDELVHATVAGADVVAVVKTESDPKVGESVTLIAPEAHVHVFDPATEAALTA